MSKNNDNITKTIPAALATRLATMTDIVSAAYDSGFEDGFKEGKREGETHALRRRRELAEAWNDHGQPLVAGIKNAIDQTDMHGEPLPGSDQQPDDVKTLATRKVQLHGGHRRVIDLLSRGNYLAAPTIAGLIDVKRSAVWTYLQQINACDDYVVEKKQLPGRARGYRTLYRVAKAA